MHTGGFPQVYPQGNFVMFLTLRSDVIFPTKNIFQNVRFVMIFDLKMSDQNDRLEA
jgi:hypothetical protein